MTAEPEALAASPPASGVFLVDKPAGCSSFAMVRRVRRLLGIKKVGHAGTLDPFATGLLVLCAGREATRHIADFMEGRKCYTARLQLGVETSTQDPEGEVTSTRPVQGVAMDTIQACLNSMAGEQWQAPPAFSALKHKGKPLYHYARKGIMISKPPRPVQIYSLDALHYAAESCQLDIAVSCSRGTYIRVLAADIGSALGCGAHLISLRRTASGCFDVAKAVDGELLFQDEGGQALLAARLNVEDALARTAEAATPSINGFQLA